MIDKSAITITTILSTIVTIISLSIGGIVWADSRYAKNEDVQKLMIEQRKQFVELKRSTIDDRLFELQLIPVEQRTALDHAKIERYKRKLEEMNQPA